MNNISFGNPSINLTVNTALVGLAAYASRSYIAINPKHAAIFGLGTFLASVAARVLTQVIGEKEYNFTGRSIRTIAVNVLPSCAAISFKVFTPIQALATLGLVTSTASAYYAITGQSIWRI